MNKLRDFCPRWLHWYAVLTSAATLFLLFVGALVTSTGSSLAVPDWPLSFGQFFPRMVGGVLYEHGHRMVAGTVGILMLGLCVCMWLVRAIPPYVRWTATGALFAVVLQAVLGGVTVLYRLPPAVSVAHACLAQVFFCLTVALSVMTSRWWVSVKPKSISDPSLFSLHLHTLLLVVLFFSQLAIGATMRHLGAGLAIPDFPLAFGGLVPPFDNVGITVHFLHRVGAVVVATMSLWLATRIYIEHFDSSALVGLVGLLVTLIAIQLVLGAISIWAARPVWITSLHLVVGASCFACSVGLALVFHRLYSPAEGKRVLRAANVTA
ncbi:MAG: heme A synthase [Bdellovibrionales bacterium]|nr:heme A synthase [Bdellovibrionales bacterium]